MTVRSRPSRSSGQLQRRGAVVEDEAHARANEPAGRGGDRAFGLPVGLAALAVVELEEHALGEHGAAVRASHLGPRLQRGEVAPHGHAAYAELPGQRGHGHARPAGEAPADLALAGR